MIQVNEKKVFLFEEPLRQPTTRWGWSLNLPPKLTCPTSRGVTIWLDRYLLKNCLKR